MIREIDSNLITPDKLLTSNSMAKLGCNNCTGCSDCCRDRAERITLDPYDARLLAQGLNYSFTGLLEQGLVTLTVVDGVVLPALAVKPADIAAEPSAYTVKDSSSTGKEECVFLNKEGRCTIHAFRPGICRMFPLARLYHEDGSFSYFLQEGECSRSNGVKIKVSKWLGYTDIRGYETAVREYHDALCVLRQRQENLSHEEQVHMQRTFLNEWFGLYI